MCSQALYAVGALCGLFGVATAVPALRYSGIAESCDITTVYITVAPPSTTTTIAQLLNTPFMNYGVIATTGLASTASYGPSDYSTLGSSSGTDSTSTAHLTSTVHQTVFLTSTITGPGTTRTETTEVTYHTSPSLHNGYTLQTNATLVDNVSSADVIMTSSSSITVSQTINSAFDSYVYPAATMKNQHSCSGDLVMCAGTSALNSADNPSTGDIITSQLIGSTSTPPIYVIETLTVIPLAALPTLKSSDLTTTLTAQTTVPSTMIDMLTEVASSSPVMASIVYGAGLTGTASASSSSASYSSLGAGGWNISSSSSVSLSGASLLSIGTTVSTSLAVDALSSATSTSPASSYSAASINFSNSYIFPNVSSALAAQSGFTALPASSTPSSSAGSPSSGEYLSLTSISSSLSQTSEAALTESRSEIDSSTSAIDTLQSTAMPSIVTESLTRSPLCTSVSAQTTSEALWTESCSDENSSTSIINTEQSNIMSVSGYSSSVSSSTPYTSTLAFLNSTSPFNYSSATASASASITSDVAVAQSTSADLSNTNPLYSGTVPTASSVSQMPSPSSSESMSTTYITVTTTSTSGISLFTASGISVSSGVTPTANSPATTFSELSSLSPNFSLSYETSVSSSSSVPPPTIYESTSMILSTLATSIHLTTASSESPVDDTCTESIVPPSILTSSTPTSSILTFTTLASSVSLSTFTSNISISSTASLIATTVSFASPSSPTATFCGEHGSFTLNFDDLPQLSVVNNTIVDPMPLFSPYHQFYFSSGWTIVPPPTDPYKPSSTPLLVEFLPNPGSALGYTGAIGNGENVLLGCFTFNALSMSLGCDSLGPDCDWQFTGLRYNNFTKATDTITSQKTSTAACPGLSNCDLVPVVLDASFMNLTELRINVTVAGVEKIWWLDDLHLAWFDDSCDAGLCRIQHA